MFDHVRPAMKIWQDEILRPVLSIVRVDTLDEAIAIANQSEFANGACLFTDSASAIRQFRETIDAGMLGVNIGVPRPWRSSRSRAGRSRSTATCTPTAATASSSTRAARSSQPAMVDPGKLAEQAICDDDSPHNVCIYA